MDFGSILENFLVQTKPLLLAAFVVKIVVLTVLIWVVARSKIRFQRIVLFVLVILLFRTFLFDNYLTWYALNKYLSVDDIGFRQKDVLSYEYTKFLKNDKKDNTFILSVGSSQSGKVYHPFSENHKDIVQTFTMSGFGPLDLWLYKDYILSYRPQYVFLYLSEFDMARKPEIDTAKIAPVQGIALSPVLVPVFRSSLEFGTQFSFFEFVAGEVLPEYKYSFLSKGVLDKFFQKNKAMGVELLTEIPDEVYLETQLKNIELHNDERGLKYTFYFLNRFLQFCRSRSVKVVIVEGQYNPLAYTPEARRLNKLTHARLEGLSEKYPNLVFVPRDDTLAFSASDYQDGYHVKPEPAYQYVEKLLGDLERKGVLRNVPAH